MKKRLAYILGMLFALAVVASLSFLTAFAAEGTTVVYLQDGGTGDGSSPDKAVGTLNKAYDTLDLSKDCTIVLCGTFTQELSFSYGLDYTGSVTFTSVYGGTDYRNSGAVYQFAACRFVCFGDTRFENMDFQALSTNLLVIGQHHPVTIGEGVTMTGDDSKFTGGSIAKAFAILGGYQNSQDDPPFESDKDTNITVLSGSKLYIVPFSRQILGTYTGTAHIKIGGNADVSVLHGSAAYPDGVIVGDVKVELSGEANVRNFYGCTQDTVENSFELTWKSGTIGVFEWTCSYTPGKFFMVTDKTVLKASDAVQKTEKYSEIAGNFDVVLGENGEASTPVATSAPAATEATATSAPATSAPATSKPFTTTVVSAPDTSKPAATTAKPDTSADVSSKTPESTAPSDDATGTGNGLMVGIIIAAVCVVAVVIVVIVFSKKKQQK